MGRRCRFAPGLPAPTPARDNCRLIVHRPLAEALDLPAPTLVLPPACLGRRAGPSGTSIRCGWFEGPVYQVRQPFGCCSPVGPLASVLAAGDDEEAIGDPATQALVDPDPLLVGEDRRPADGPRQPDGRVGGVDRLAARAARPGEGPRKLLLRDGAAIAQPNRLHRPDSGTPGQRQAPRIKISAAARPMFSRAPGGNHLVVGETTFGCASTTPSIGHHWGVPCSTRLEGIAHGALQLLSQSSCGFWPAMPTPQPCRTRGVNDHASSTRDALLCAGSDTERLQRTSCCRIVGSLILSSRARRTTFAMISAVRGSSSAKGR